MYGAFTTCFYIGVVVVTMNCIVSLIVVLSKDTTSDTALLGKVLGVCVRVVMSCIISLRRIKLCIESLQLLGLVLSDYNYCAL